MHPPPPRHGCVTAPYAVRDPSYAWEEALGQIARLAPAGQPEDQEHESLEEAEAHGLRLGLWEAASIARQALTEDRGDRADASAASYAALTENERDHLRALNRILVEIERRFHPAAVDINRRLRARVGDCKDSLTDYEVYLSIDLYLAEGDPAWNEDEDNVIGSVVEHLTDVDEVPEFGFGALDTNHAEPGRFPGEHHAWTYHCIYDHSKLGWRDLLHVGVVWVDFIVTEQTAIQVASSATCAATEES